MVWRGPIVNSAIDKFLLGTAWGRLDILVVDMPPGELLVESESSQLRVGFNDDKNDSW